MKLWHCQGARSLRPLWALEEMDLDYALEILPFPPRKKQPGFLEINPLGTVPFFTDGHVQMTESTAICQYLVERYEKREFGLATDHPEYGAYINWLYQSDATLTFPQTIAFRYYLLEPNEALQPVADSYVAWFHSRLKWLQPNEALQPVADSYVAWFHSRLKWLHAHLECNRYLVDDRFTIADIAIGYALYLGRMLKFCKDYPPKTQDYLDALMERPAFKRAKARR